MVILLLFFCSGVTALVYEVIWSKYLALLFGSTIQAQTVVLAVFMGGLALGNKVFGARADRTHRPLVIYGWIEFAIGLYALFFSLIYVAADAVFIAIGSKLLDQTLWLLLLKGVISVAMLLGPTILMGGTLPVLAAWLQKSGADAGRRSARLYSINSLGAVCGAGLAGFLLVQNLGMPLTLKITALVNMLIGIVAINIGKKGVAPPPSSGGTSASSEPELSQAASAILRWGCILVAFTGGVSMGLEVLASRCLGLIFGSSLQVFAIVLMAFILGISLGSAAIASPRWRRWPGEISTIMLLLGTAAFLCLLVSNIENLVLVYRYARSGLSHSSVGYRYYQLLTAVLAICVLGLPAAALGSVLPLWMRVVSETSPLLGNRVGQLLTWNTLGAVGGVLLTGFVLMPKIGIRGSFAALGLVLAGVAVFAAMATGRRFAALTSAVVAVFLVVISATGSDNWRYMFSAGIFRISDTDETLRQKIDRSKYVDLLFYEDAADATVSIERQKDAPQIISLSINGKGDASSFADLPTQIYLGQLPLLAKPESKDVFVFGMGSGITAATVLGYPIRHLTIAENCEPVLRAAKFFEPWNHVVLTNDRVRIYHEDARTVLKLSPDKYDVIIAEPSNPWVVGVGSVFSREFYQCAANRLKPGGIMGQWFHTYEMEDGVVNLVIRTFAQVFPYMEIWDSGVGDIYMLGSDRPWESDPEVYRRAFALPGPRGDLAAIGLFAPEEVLARQVASQRTAFAIGGPGPIQTDFQPILEYEAPRAFYMAQNAEGLWHYDERTWQMDLATAQKNQMLARLSGRALNALFHEPCPSFSKDLQAYVDLRSEGIGVSDVQLSVPCVFRGTNDTLIYVPLAGKTNLMIQQLCAAEGALRAAPPPAEMVQAVQSIYDVLNRIQPSDLTDPERKADYYADLAVKACLRLGDAAAARAILLRGLQLEPDSQQLGYLSRILMREGVVQATDLSSPDKRYQFQ